MYFITCFDDKWLQNNRWFFGLEKPPRDEEGKIQYRKSERRTFGYFPSKEEALEAVRQNCCDLHESLYTVCVVERIPPGIHAFDLNEPTVWFNWVDDGTYTGRWEEMPQPRETERLTAFALG